MSVQLTARYYDKNMESLFSAIYGYSKSRVDDSVNVWALAAV